MVKNFVISNEKLLKEKVKSMAKDGKESLHIITDFDRTLTKAFVNGKYVPSLISVLRDGNYLTADYSGKAHALRDKYYPIEINPNISLKEKKKAMSEWWATHFEMLIKSRLNKRDLEKVVKSGKVQFRKGALEFLDFLHANDIPTIILSSSGLGKDSISMYLENVGRLYDNIYIISNSFKWDKSGRVVSIKEPIIHSMNKDETSIKDFPFYKKIKDRKNVLLLGDSLGDVGMVAGFDYDNIIKIGFLNENVEENLEKYKSAYDVIILNDWTMEYVNRLAREIIK